MSYQKINQQKVFPDLNLININKIKKKLILIINTEKETLNPPFFVEHLKLTQTFTEGHDAILNCTWGGNPPSLIQWQKDGQVLTPDQPYKIETQVNNSKLFIKTAKKEDRGLYACIIANDAGSNLSKTQINIIGIILNIINKF